MAIWSKYNLSGQNVCLFIPNLPMEYLNLSRWSSYSGAESKLCISASQLLTFFFSILARYPLLSAGISSTSQIQLNNVCSNSVEVFYICFTVYAWISFGQLSFSSLKSLIALIPSLGGFWVNSCISVHWMSGGYFGTGNICSFDL